MNRVLLLSTLGLACSADMLGAQVLQPGSRQPTPSQTPPSPIAELRLFEDMLGVWLVSERHFDEQGMQVAEAEGTEEIVWELDKHAVRRVYATSSDWRSYRATGMLTFNQAAGRFEGYWMDNFSKSGPTRVQGVFDAAKRQFDFTVTTMTPDGQPIELHVEDRFVSDENRIATTYVRSGDKSVKRMEVRYKRPPPCDATPRIIGGFDG